MKRNLLAGFVVLMIAVTCAWAQTGSTSLRGTVTDKTGASVGDAKVSLDNLGQAFHRETPTSTTGEYDFVALPPGTYALTIEKAGFRRYEQKNLQLLVNLPATVNAKARIFLHITTSYPIHRRRLAFIISHSALLPPPVPILQSVFCTR